ncbi:MAG: hypothetical protein GKR89_19450 [Candidatus Latescibacteria bacterium]|nr:hypothetical protein [Candidatus Latescibacterota bacterium]
MGFGWCAVRIGILAVCWTIGIANSAAAQRRVEDYTPPTLDKLKSGLYGSAGLGFLNLEKGVGISLPVGLTAIASSYRLVASVSLVDIGLLEGQNRDPRYFRVTTFGQPVCVDRQTGFRVSDFRCSGGTDALRAASVDLSFIVFEELWLGGRPGRVLVGGGYRFMNPGTPYGTISLYFDARKDMLGGFKAAVGQEYVFFGVFWALDLRRVF